MKITAGRATTLAIGLPLMLVVAAWGGVNATSIMAGATEHHTATYAWRGGTISLATDGRIQVVTGRGDQVGVAYAERYTLRKPTISGAATADGGVTLTATCPGHIYSGYCGVDYVLTVPPTAQLHLKTGDGSIEISGTTGPISAHSGDGGITLTGVAGSVNVSTGDGGIGGNDLTSASVQASTGDGGIRLGFATPPTTVSATSGDGGIAVTVPHGSGPYRVEATSGDGGVRVTVPTDLNADRTITVHTGDGGVIVEPES